MESRKDSNTNGSHIRENLNEAILVQARLIAQLRMEVDKLKAPNHRAKRQSIKN